MHPLFNLLAAAAIAWPGDSTRFPVVEGSNLEGRKFVLPDGFEGDRNLVFVAFQRWHQELIDDWVPVTKALLASHPGLRYYELPTLKRGTAPWRWMLNRGMAMGIPDKGAREATITLYLDKAAFRSALGIADESDIHVLLLDKQGNILWRTQGRVDEPKRQALAAALGR